MSKNKVIEEQNLPDLFYVLLVFILIFKKIFLIVLKPFIYFFKLIL